VRHSHAVIESTQTLFSDLLDVESGVRGYMGTGDLRFLDHYAEAKNAAPVEMAKLRVLVNNNAGHVARAERLTGLDQQRLSIAAKRVDLKRQGHPVETHAFAPGSGKSAMDQARVAMADLMGAERLLLDEHTAAADHDQ
jgi:methyl-accepting chemotaxis protein